MNESQDKQIIELPAERSIEAVQTQIQKIQQLMNLVMRGGEHYGVIPGTDKPTLYKAGAEKLGFTFRLVPRFRIVRNELPNWHREYEVICTLLHTESGQFAGQGVGNCSTMESKYRYRYSDEITQNPVPSKYWDIRKDQPKEAQQLLGGPGFKARKINGSWVIVKQGEKAENPDIADCYNTVLKMAKKRAHVDAMITACAASDIFAQDLEDLSDNEPGHGADEGQGTGEQGSPKKTRQKKPGAPPPTPPPPEDTADLEEELRQLLEEHAGALNKDDVAKVRARAGRERGNTAWYLKAVARARAEIDKQEALLAANVKGSKDETEAKQLEIY